VTGDEYAITSLLHPVSTADHFGGNTNERPSKKRKKSFIYVMNSTALFSWIRSRKK
jgi:hypothetical protein